MIRRLNTAVPAEVLRGADAIKRFAARYSSNDDWSVYGLGPVHHRDARIAEQQREIESRDRLIRTFTARETTARKMITDRDARLAELEAALLHQYNEQWECGDGLSNAYKIRFLVVRSKEAKS